jgi:hypothetical protein
MKIPKNLGMLSLAIWLILYGLVTAPFSTSTSPTAEICCPCWPLRPAFCS